jgi:hypothetical protein
MSFDRYFESKKQQARRSQNSDDWYAIVEEALYAAEMASRLNRQQLEINLMKPLPMIPEDDATATTDLSSEHNSSSRSSSVTGGLFHLKSADSSRGNLSRKLDVKERVEEVSDAYSLYDADFESLMSAESEELEAWAGDVCSTGRISMSSLRSKPYTRQSSYTDSAVSERRVSTGSSIVVGRSKSKSSSVYSTETQGTSLGSPGSSAKSTRTYSLFPSEKSAAATCQPRSEDREKKSFFEFSDSDEEKKKKEEVAVAVTVARSQSSASSYVRQLRNKALSLRQATSKMARERVRSMSLPSGPDGPARSTWFFRRSSIHVDRIPTSTTDYLGDLELSNELMLGAAASAKAKRVLGL